MATYLFCDLWELNVLCRESSCEIEIIMPSFQGSRKDKNELIRTRA